MIHKPALRQIIDQWLLILSEEQFISYLPILRRAFSTFSVEEKEAIYDLLFSGRFMEERTITINQKRRELVLQGVKQLLD